MTSSTATTVDARRHARAQAGTAVEAMPTVPPWTARDLPAGVAPAAVVWDEVVAFLLVLYFVGEDTVRIAVAFVVFRFFDIVKPPPIRQLDARLKNGIGVMADDFLAAGYTLLALAVGQRLVG